MVRHVHVPPQVQQLLQLQYVELADERVAILQDGQLAASST